MGQAQTEAGLGSDRGLCSRREVNATVYAVRSLLPLDYLPSPHTMSDQPQLPGYSVDDDTHDDNDDTHHIDVATTEPERPADPVLSASADDAVASTATATVSPPTRQESTQSSPTPPNQQEAEEEEHLTAAATLTTPPLPVDEFADPKISGLHAVFPDYDAAIL